MYYCVFDPFGGAILQRVFSCLSKSDEIDAYLSGVRDQLSSSLQSRAELCVGNLSANPTTGPDDLRPGIPPPGGAIFLG